MAFAAFIDHLLNFHFSWFPLEAKISTYWHVCNGGSTAWGPVLYLSKSTGVNVCDMSRIGTRKTPCISMPCQRLAVPDPVEMAPFYCAGQAHMWISLLNTKSISLLSLLVFVKQTLPRHQTLLFPTELFDLGEPKRRDIKAQESRVLSKIPINPSLIIFSCLLTHPPVSRKLWAQTVTLWILKVLGINHHMSTYWN